MFFNSRFSLLLLVALPAVAIAQPVDILTDTPFTSEDPVTSETIVPETTTDVTEMPAEEVAAVVQEETPVTPETSVVPVHASYYADRFHGRTTANGERFNMNALTAAHKELPFGTRVRVAYQGRSVVVRINDRGPYIRGRDIDLSRAAAAQIGLIQRGHGRVTMEIL